MNTSKKILFIVLALGLIGFAPVPVFAQATLSSTTLSAAVNACTMGQINTCQHVISLTSTSGILAPGQPTSTTEIGTPTGASFYILCTDKECMQILAVNTTANTVTVARGYQGTVATAHVSGAKVWYGVPEYFFNASGGSGETGPSGACTATALRVQPAVVIPTLDVFNCANGAWWKLTPVSPFAGSTIATGTGSNLTVAPNGSFQTVSGTGSIQTITVPLGFPSGGAIQFIPSAIFTTVTGGNIALGSTAVVGKALTLMWNGTAWDPSY